MDKLQRLALKSEHAFWSLVEQAGMTAVLAPKAPKQASGIRRVYKTTSKNVISVQFRNDDFTPTRISAAHRYQPETGRNKVFRWKQRTCVQNLFHSGRLDSKVRIQFRATRRSL